MWRSPWRRSILTRNAVEARGDLGCGTGRPGLARERGAGRSTGSTSRRGCWRRRAAEEVYCVVLREGEVGDTGLESGAYDLVVSCLVDEHLADLRPLYAERRGLARRGGASSLVGFHPHFIIASGMPTHFDDADSGASRWRSRRTCTC